MFTFVSLGLWDSCDVIERLIEGGVEEVWTCFAHFILGMHILSRFGCCGRRGLDVSVVFILRHSEDSCEPVWQTLRHEVHCLVSGSRIQQ